MQVCKGVPLYAIEVLGGEGRYSSYPFLTSALYGVEWSESRHGRALPPEKETPVTTGQRTGWDPEPFWTQKLEEKYFVTARDRTPAKFVVRHYTD
jgi:hypothetical protein